MNNVQKNKLLLPSTGIIIVLCWYLAFSKTVEAIRVNRQLTNQPVNTEDISFNQVYAKRKLVALDRILGSYRVNETQWSDQLWLRASAIAMKYGMGIDYTMSRPVDEADTTTAGDKETLYCYGNFLQLVKLIDTLEKLPSIGQISALQIKAPKADAVAERGKQCLLKLTFRGLKQTSKHHPWDEN